MHQKPSQRATWAPAGIDGWYVGPDFERYQCYTCVNCRTNKVVHPDTVAWFPHQMPMPTAAAQLVVDNYQGGDPNVIATNAQNKTKDAYLTNVGMESTW